MEASSHPHLRQLFDDYLRMYASRDERLVEHFSEDFSGFTGGGDFLVKDQAAWVAITRQDFAQVKDSLRIELKDVSIQSLADTIAVATGFFTIHLPMEEQILSRETARLVLVFRREAGGWKIAHSSISIPYAHVQPGEVYPLRELADRNRTLEETVAERTRQLSESNEKLQQANRDLTNQVAERRQAEMALYRSEELYRSILQASPDDITITDRDGRILMISPMALAMFRGRPDGNFLGRSVLEFIVPEDREKALFHLAQKREARGTGANEYRGLRTDGSTFPIEVNSEFIRDPAGVPTGMVVIVRDITERKQAEEERSRLEIQNQQLQKSESLGRMAGAIAHHFNNQLHAVIMGLEVARQELPAEAGSAGVLDVALRSARKAAEVSSTMLTYLGQAHVRLEPLDLAETCQRRLALLQAVMPRNIALETDWTLPGPRVLANANQIQQVLTNLLTNAWEASEGGGGNINIRIMTLASAEIVPGAEIFPVNWHPQDQAYACLEVTDEGCGIAAADLAKLFDPFFSRKFAGRGLGLPVVLGIARAHDGAVAVSSRPGRGSVFRVYIPVSEAAVPSSTGPRFARAVAAGPGTVLLVDDEPAVRQMGEHVLRRLGFEVCVAGDGFAAVELFRQQQGKIAAVLCDVSMPRMSGWETLTALRKLAPGIPVILASGFSEAEVMEGDHPDRPQGFLHKPYEIGALQKVLAEVMAAERP